MKKIALTFILLISMMLTACADTGQSEAVPASEETNVEESTDVNSDDDTATARLVTEEDYRNAIASASNDDKKLELYTEFSSVYKMTEQEYLEYAALCEKAGDTVSARKALFALYRSDPTEQHGQMLSDMTVRITPADDDKAQGLLESLLEEVKKCEDEDFSPDAIKQIIASDDWMKSFYIDNGTFTSNTEFSGDTLNAVVDSDNLYTRAVITAGDDRYMCAVSYNGVDAGHEQLKDQKPEGKYYYRQKDAENVDIVIANGYIKDGHYVNQLDITVSDIPYSGTFDDAGKTKEEQPQGFAGVVYAYTSDGSNYLYVEDADPQTFVANVGDMGFAEF